MSKITGLQFLFQTTLEHQNKGPGQQYSRFVQNEQQFCTKTIKSSRD